MDRYIKTEFECEDCEINYEVRYDKSNPDECVCCPFCGSTSINKIDPENKDEHNGMDDETRPDLREEE
jgi:hypothetical protein